MEYESKIIQLYEKMLAEDKFLTTEKLQECYSRFRENFGPERLKSLDGEVLLNTMFNHSNKNSLVYWLEFKNDEELPARFGGIAGGSAIKFGIYRRKEDGKWITGNSRDMQAISIESAIQIAREKRDLLLKGAGIIEAMPDNYEDSTYIKLQEDLDSYVGSITDTAWVHKYYHMLYPDRIDDYHAPNYQRFYLIKMLQEPVKENGRYALAGQFMRTAKKLGMPINHFTQVLGVLFGPPHAYWRIGTTDGEESYWDKMLGGGYVSIGWPKLGNLNQVIDSVDMKAKERIKELLNQHYANTPSVISKWASQILYFVRYIKPGDIIIASQGQTILGLGRVIGEYEYKESLEYPHTLAVQWLYTEHFKLPDPLEGLHTAVFGLKNFNNMIAIEKKLQTTTPTPPVMVPPLSGIAGQIESVLHRKKQVILYGPPGTGKTYWAEKAAMELASRKVFCKPYDMLSETEKSYLCRYVRMCCFHPSYGYEDFIEGIKPAVENGQAVFNLKPGIFKNLCNDAKAEQDKNFYIIIDEINRGDISRIFGELITLIETGKRGKEIVLPISGHVFSVPENVYIIGTMNTADRSIALLDVALRRRFGFIELMPDTGILSDTVIEGLPLGLWLEELNKRIRENIGRDSRNLQIGHSYFMENGRVITEFDRLRRVIAEDIIPLIEEYCYGDYTAVSKIIGSSLVDVNKQLIRQELFHLSNKAELISALLQMCPELSTSSKVIGEDSSLEESETDAVDSLT